MAPLTDVTFQELSDFAARPAAEISSSVSESGTGRGNPIDLMPEHKKHEDEISLGTGVGAPQEIPFLITKEGARKIAELTSDEEYSSLIAQRQALAHKQLEENLSRDEVLRLRLIEWTIDCVETSRPGLNLDSLQQVARTHEIIAARVSRTVEQLEAILESEAAEHRYRRRA